MDPYKKKVFTVLGILLAVSFGINRWVYRDTGPLAPELFLAPAGKEATAFESFQTIMQSDWKDGYVAPILEIISFVAEDRRPVLYDLLKARTGASNEGSKAWWEWYWQSGIEPYEGYPVYKQYLYQQFDPAMGLFFGAARPVAIPMDQIFWQQMKPNVIKPMVFSPNQSPDKVDFIGQGNIVVGVRLGEEGRAYPRELLTMHRLIEDRILGDHVYLFYSPLSGAVCAYTLREGAKEYTWRHSGFVARADEVFYDEETGSMWSPISGTPISGPLVGTKSPFKPVPLAQISYAQWLEENPSTRVAMPWREVEYRPDAEYVSYLAEPKTSIPFPWKDDRLDKKAPVVVVRDDALQEPGKGPLVVFVNHLISNPVTHLERNGKKVVFLTTPRGQVRCFFSEDVQFDRAIQDEAQSIDGKRWKIRGQRLVSEEGRELEAVAVHPMLWMAARSWFPELELFKGGE